MGVLSAGTLDISIIVLRNAIRAYLKTAKTPKQRLFFRVQHRFSLQYAQYSSKVTACAEKESLAGGNIASFQMRPSNHIFPFISKSPACHRLSAGPSSPHICPQLRSVTDWLCIEKETEYSRKGGMDTQQPSAKPIFYCFAPCVCLITYHY